MKIQATFLLSTLVLGAAAQAQIAAPAPAKAPEPDYTLSFNAGVVSDYRYRGLSQTRSKAAVQAGADLAHKSGAYLGVWASNIRWIRDYGQDGSLEVDVYGGYKGTAGFLSYDIGYLRYEYAGNKLAAHPSYENANTQEAYLALSAGPATLKYSHSLGNLFGNPGSKSSGYVDLSANFDLGNGLTLTPHMGGQYIKNTPNGSYTDYAITLTKDLGKGLAVSAMAVSTDADKTFYSAADGSNNGRSGLVVGAKYTF